MEGFSLCQTKYVETLVHHFKFKNYRPIATPMKTSLQLSPHHVNDAFDVTLYHQVVECLIYLCIIGLEFNL